ncbi:hypothetical protein WA158_004743 [Blastocystis sp. Blastoise]
MSDYKPYKERVSIFRLPEELVGPVDEALENDSSSVNIEICSYDPKQDKYRKAFFYFQNHKFPAIIYNLPRNVETYKTIDKTQFYKTNDISQIIEVFMKESDIDEKMKKFDYNNGLTPPTHGALKSLNTAEQSLQKYPKEEVKQMEDLLIRGKDNTVCSTIVMEDLIEEEECMQNWGETQSFLFEDESTKK